MNRGYRFSVHGKAYLQFFHEKRVQMTLQRTSYTAYIKLNVRKPKDVN